MDLVAEVVVRPADAEDAEAIAIVHVAAWRSAFASFLPRRFLEAMTPTVMRGKWDGDLADPATSMFVATDDAQVLGFLQVRADRVLGEVMSLYVDPARWSHGVGSVLLAFGESWLAARGVVTTFLWTARDSQQSRAFYERRGWSASGDEQTQHLGLAAVALHEVEYRKSLSPERAPRS